MYFHAAIKRDDFEKIMREKFAQRDPTEEIVKAFKLFDEVSGTTDDREHLLSFVLPFIISHSSPSHAPLRLLKW